jgi:hypothetical protein
MKRCPQLILGALVVVLVAVGAYQGRRIDRIREAELFYRWILAEATQERVFTEKLEAPMVSTDQPQMMDRPLFHSIVDVAEGVLPGEGGVDERGKPVKKLVKFAEEGRNDVVWDLASGDRLARHRRDFLQYLREKRLVSVASEFNAEDIYSGGQAGVSLGNIFFGFRKVAANFVWLQVDKYWHQGMMHRMIPLMKTCVALDPNFIDAYLLGAWHLAYNATAKLPDTPEPLKKYHPKYGARLGEKELYYYLAIDFLKDGIRKNPANYKLLFDLGFAIYDIKLKDYANAVRYLSAAIRRRHDRWVPRQLYICMEKNGQYEDALAGWKDYLEKNRDNPVESEKAERFIARNEGMIQEKTADQALDRAKNARNPAEADALRAEAEKCRNEALKIWQAMTGGGGEPDPFALGRILRMKALKLIGEQRYLEAIAVLQNAWSKSAPFAEEALDMIIDTKLKADIPLSTSEKKAVMRREEAEKYKQLPPPETQ